MSDKQPEQIQEEEEEKDVQQTSGAIQRGREERRSRDERASDRASDRGKDKKKQSSDDQKELTTKMTSKRTRSNTVHPYSVQGPSSTGRGRRIEQGYGVQGARRTGYVPPPTFGMPSTDRMSIAEQAYGAQGSGYVPPPIFGMPSTGRMSIAEQTYGAQGSGYVPPPTYDEPPTSRRAIVGQPYSAQTFGNVPTQTYGRPSTSHRGDTEQPYSAQTFSSVTPQTYGMPAITYGGVTGQQPHNRNIGYVSLEEQKYILPTIKTIAGPVPAISVVTPALHTRLAERGHQLQLLHIPRTNFYVPLGQTNYILCRTQQTVGTEIVEWKPMDSFIQFYYASIRNQMSGLDQTDYVTGVSYGYLFHRLLGEGSYGGVYRVTNIQNNRNVAIKVLKPTVGGNVDAMHSECELAQLLQSNPHNNILAFQQIYTTPDRDRSYIVSELAPVGDITNILQKYNRQGIKVMDALKPIYCQHLIRGIAHGVAFLKSLGIAHCDIKLANILAFMSAKGTSARVESKFLSIVPKLTDFSNSTMSPVGEPNTCNIPLATIDYAAPETWFNNNEVYDCYAADVYSVGVCLMLMLTGANPWKPCPTPQSRTKLEEFMQEMTKHKRQKQRLENICHHFDIRLREVLIRLLEPYPENRITIEEFVGDEWFTSHTYSETDPMPTPDPSPVAKPYF